jgi:uncharacterized membrane protein
MEEIEQIDEKQRPWYLRYRRERREKQRLGFLRIWEVLFFIVVASNIVALVFGAHMGMSLTFDAFLELVDVVCSGVVVWLISQRKRVTRLFVPLYALTMIAIGSTGDLFLNNFVFSFSYFLPHGRYLFIFAGLYFLLSKKARVLLDKPFAVRSDMDQAGHESNLYRLRDLGFWRDLALFFMVCSVVGHWMELGYSTLMRVIGGPYDPSAQVWQSYLMPFSTYGVGAVVCILLLFPLKQVLMRRLKHVFLVLLLVYIVNTLVCTIIELAVGLAFNHPGADGKLMIWDYSNLPFNFMGQICLQNALLFGAVATLMVWVIFPAVEGFVLTRSEDEVNMVFVIILTIWLMLAAFYIVAKYVPIGGL